MGAFLFKSRISAPFLGAVLVVLAACSPTSGLQAEDDLLIISHDVTARFDVPGHQVTFVDQLGVPAGLEYLRLGKGLTVTGVKGPRGAAELDSVLTPAEDEDGPYQRLNLATLNLTGGGDLTLTYNGVFHESVENTTFSRENVGNEITATISDEGIYLSGSAEWLAWNPEAMAVHTLHCDTPADFETVTQGERTGHQVVEDRLFTTWTARFPSDGLNFIANRYVVHEEPVREGVISYTFFLEDDARLRATYMERTKAYIAMYEEMIGPYPYTKFATVENWFPTGYGMPSYTLLGGQVLRLPFIPYTSFGHEIAHNWWGNSVFVDTGEGNWCEGLTVYCADYHYKDLDNPDGAFEYRRNVLKDYAAYVHDPSFDFPLSEFKSRHSGATRAVGYGKSMMVFHMTEQLIGPEAFQAGLQKIAREHLYKKTTWSDFFGAFSERSGKDLSSFQEQWLQRTGAALISVDKVEFKDNKVAFKLIQGAPPYDLQVPVVVKTSGGAEDHLVHFNKMNQNFEIDVQGATELSIDPRCHIFRRLHPEEIEPTLSQVLGVDMPAFIMDGPTEIMAQAGRSFAQDFTEMKEGFAFNQMGQLIGDVPPSEPFAHVVINPGSDLLKQYLPSELVLSGKTFFLGGKRYNLNENDLVFAASNPMDPSRTDLIILCDSAPRLQSLARRVVHYGKYSWLVMPQGQGSVVKGNWALAGSPLVIAKGQ